MSDDPVGPVTGHTTMSLFARLRRRGVLRVAASYAVIAWLVLQIGDVTFEPLGAPPWLMVALIVAAIIGFPVALALAWFLEATPRGIEIDRLPPDLPRPVTRGLRHYADLIIIGVLVLVVAVLLVRDRAREPAANRSVHSIAVLPFTNLSGQSDSDYLADGIAAELLDRLSRVTGLEVVAQSSSFQFRGQQIDARSVAAKLGVSVLLEGSVRRSGARLLVSTQLVDGARGINLWSQSYERPYADLLDVQREIAESVVAEILPRVVDAAAVRLPGTTANVQAADLVMLARFEENKGDPDALRHAADLYRQAVALDSGYVEARARLGRAVLQVWNASGQRDAAVLADAQKTIFAALAAAPDLSEAHEALGLFYRYTNRSGGGAEYARAIELNPSNASARFAYASWLMSNARPRDALAQLAVAARLDPLSVDAHYYYLAALRNLEGEESFQQQLEVMLRLLPESPDLFLLLADLDRFTGHAPAAGAWLRRVLAVDPHNSEAAFAIAEDSLSRDDVDFARRWSARVSSAADANSLAVEFAFATGDRAATLAAAAATTDNLRAGFVRAVYDDVPAALRSFEGSDLPEKVTDDDRRQLIPTIFFAPLLVCTLRTAGRAEEAERLLDANLDWLDRYIGDGMHGAELYMARARLNAARGARARSLEDFQAAVMHGYAGNFGVAGLRVDPCLAPLRDEPAFHAGLATLADRHRRDQATFRAYLEGVP